MRTENNIILFFPYITNLLIKTIFDGYSGSQAFSYIYILSVYILLIYIFALSHIYKFPLRTAPAIITAFIVLVWVIPTN